MHGETLEFVNFYSVLNTKDSRTRTQNSHKIKL